MRIVATCLAVLALAGCADLTPQPLEPQASKMLRRIAVVETAEPEKYIAFDRGHPGMYLGITSALVTGSTMEAEGEQFTSALRGRHFQIGRRLTESTAAALMARGYQVRVVSGHALDIDADAVLRLTADTAGYVAPGFFTRYQPALGVVAELVPVGRDPDAAALYRDRFMFGWEGIRLWVQVPAPREYSYRTFAELMMRTAEAAEGLELGADLIADRIARDLDRAR